MHYLLMRQREAMVVKHQEVLAQAEKAAALMREKSLVFAATNHDLRQPLFGVSLFADLLKSAPTSAERRAHAHKLDMALKEVDDFLVGIQQLAVVHEVAYKPEFVQVKLDDLLAPLIEEYRGRAKYKRVTIRYVPSRLSITTHVPYFQRIVRNILSNAIRYGYPGGRVLVGCRRGGGLHLVIADTGRGMTEEQASRAFDAFQRFDVDKGIQDGFGLGLYSTKVLANALGLIVSLSSLSGRGTVFNIHLTAQDG
jgi:signal transduction histidine kinase